MGEIIAQFLFGPLVLVKTEISPSSLQTWYSFRLFSIQYGCYLLALNILLREMDCKF